MKRWLVAAVALCVTQGCSDDLPELTEPREHRGVDFHIPQKACASCHPNHVAEWEISNHAYAMHDPVFAAMVKVGQRQSSGKLGQFCVQCHSPIGMAEGQTKVSEIDGVFQQNLDVTPIAKSGVSCDICHSVTDVLEPRNARMVYTPDGTYRGPIQDPLPSDAHDSVYSPLHETSDLCGSCHNVTNPAGAAIEETYDEWAASDFAKEGGKTCQDCHMPTYDGTTTPDTAVERTLHRHTFVGVDVSLLPPEEFPGYEKMRELTRAMLRDAVNVQASVDGASRQLTVSIENLAGHRLPSGATAERQMWLEVVVSNEDRSLVYYETGTLDGQGDLRVDDEDLTVRPGTDPVLVKYGQDLLGAEGELVQFPWQAKAVDNHLLEPGATDTHVFELDTPPAGEVRVTIRLLFRTFPPYFLRELEELGDLDPEVKTRVPIVAMFDQEMMVVLEGPPFDFTPPPPACDGDTVADCKGDCYRAAWVGDGECDDGRQHPYGNPDFNCMAHDFDGGDCSTPPPECESDEVLDCDDACWPLAWLGDGTCDDGSQQSWGNPNFDCTAYFLDYGDCEPPPVEDPPIEGPCGIAGWIPDCLGECQPSDWIGDGYCDDGTEYPWGSPDFLCAEHQDDGGDCG